MSVKQTALAVALGGLLLAAVGYWIIDYSADPQHPQEGERLSDQQSREILYYRNPMGLADISPIPKKDPMGMDYIPVYADESSGTAGAIHISEGKIQRASVRLVEAERRILSRRIRGAGMVMPDEARVSVVTAKFDGFIDQLFVRTTGEEVTAGDPLFSAWIESPELLRKIADLSALRGSAINATAAQNLRLYDIPEDQIREIAQSGTAKRVITFEAKVKGTVLDKPALEGLRFKAGDPLFRIGDLSAVWVAVEIPEQDLPYIRIGEAARLTFVSKPSETFEAVVEFIYPELNLATRSAKLRIVASNSEGALKLGQFVHVEIVAPISGDAVLAVPKAAVIDDGVRQVVLVSLGDGMFAPRDVVIGSRAGEWVEIRQGLLAGEKIVAAGNFLIDAESNLQAALAAFRAKDAEQ